MNRIVVLGGTGFVGRAVCERLVERNAGGGRVLVPTRRAGHARDLWPLPTVEIAQVNVHDDAALARVLQGQDAVINLVAILHGSREAFEQVHVALPRRLAAACKAAGVRRVVHVSALGVGPQAPSNYLRSKTAGEEVLRSEGLDLTLLRPSVIFGEHDRFLNLFAQMQSVLPVVPLAGAESRYQPVWVEDVAAAVVRSLDQPSTIGQVIECAGPEVFTLKQLVETAGRIAGHQRPVFGIPEALGRVQATLMGLAPGEPLMSADNLDSMRVPNVASGTLPGLESLGIRPSAIEGVVPGYLAGRFGVARLNPWRARH